MSRSLDEIVVQQQRSEITEYIVYSNIAKKAKGKNKEVLKKIAHDEKRHHDFWKEHTRKKVKPYRFKIWFYTFLVSVLGVAFALRFMEKGEDEAVSTYKKLARKIPGVDKIVEDEIGHEKKLISLLEDGRLEYAGAVVLGLNDALVEISGTLAGLTFALGNTRVIGIVGIVMGIAAAMSMTVSSYLEAKENEITSPGKSAIATGLAYIITVFFLVMPYLLTDSVYVALVFMLLVVVLIIFLYTFFVSVAKEKNFKKSFLRMLVLSVGVMIISFIIGIIVNEIFGVNV